jgi:peroxiredoxin
MKTTSEITGNFDITAFTHKVKAIFRDVAIAPSCWYRIKKRAKFDLQTLLVAAILTVTALSPAASAADTKPEVGALAPEFSLMSIEGQPTTLSQLRGRFVVIHFAATWCPFCNAEMPNLVSLDKAYKGKDVQVLIIDVKERKATVEKMARKYGVGFPILLDEDGSVAKRYAPPKTVQPDLGRDEVMVASNLVIDKEGRIRFFSLLDTTQFDAKLITLRGVLDGLLEDR